MNRKRWRALVVMGICILITLTISYPASYFVLSKRDEVAYIRAPTEPPLRFRYCRYNWAMSVYQPLAKVEGKLTGEDVQLASWLSQAFQF